MAAILNSAILNLAILDSVLVFPLKLTHTSQDLVPTICTKKTFTHTSLGPPFAQKNFTQVYSDSTWWWQPSWILPCWIKKLHSFILTQLDDGSHLEFYHVGFRHCHLGFRHLLIFSQIHSKTLSLHSDTWLKLIQSDSNLFILTQLDDGSHLEFCHLEFGHLGFSHLSFSSQTCSHLPRLVPTICKKSLHSFILTQFDDGSHLEFYHVGLKNFTHSFWLNLMMAAILNSTMLDSKTLFSSLRFTQKHSHSTLTLIQTNLIWLKLIHSDSTWWWQPSWILPCWIQTLPSWIQTPSYLPLRFTHKTLSLHSDSN